MVDACASALGFYLFGFAFAFGDGQDDAGNLYGNNFIGFRFFAMHDMDQAQYFATAVRPYAFWVFEWAVSLPDVPVTADPSATTMPLASVLPLCGIDRLLCRHSK